MGPRSRLAVYIVIAGAVAAAIALFLLFGTGASVARDPGLAVESVVEGLRYPTSMRFLDDGSLLVLEKNTGQVRLVSDGRLVEEPVLQVEVDGEGERGLLGIATWSDGSNNKTSVYLYMTERDGELRNRVYSYDWDGRALTNRKLVLDLPGEPGPFHNGGKIVIGPDGYLYVVIGDVNAGGGMLDNQADGRPPDDKSVVLRVDRNTGMPAEDNPFYNYTGDMEKLQRYYAYGIRNSFGLDFDPVTGKLWITENGPDNYDEINIVEPGFNSGWHKIVGPISRSDAKVEDLVSFNGSIYKDPVFTWYGPVGPTDIEFFNSSNLGEKYENNIFVGDINNGNLYSFKVNKERDGLELDSPALADLVADPEGGDILGEASSVMVGERFGRITDIETGPDGYLYVLSYLDGKIHRITSK
jgi:glucose/arabinose dehydrogenase